MRSQKISRIAENQNGYRLSAETNSKIRGPVASTQVVVRPEKKLVRPSLPVQRDLSIDYLRTTLVILVLANHSTLPYISSAHFGWRNMILSDGARQAVSDYIESSIHVFCMPLMFFVSWLFVYPALKRRGAVGFLRDRCVRLGKRLCDVPGALRFHRVVAIHCAQSSDLPRIEVSFCLSRDHLVELAHRAVAAPCSDAQERSLKQRCSCNHQAAHCHR